MSFDEVEDASFGQTVSGHLGSHKAGDFFRISYIMSLNNRDCFRGNWTQLISEWMMNVLCLYGIQV